MDQFPRHEMTDRLRTIVEEFTGADASPDAISFANAIVERLQQERLLWPFGLAPENGWSETFPATVRIVYDISRISGSAGLIVAMHMSQAFTLARHAGTSPYLSGLLRRCTERQSLIASGTSEKGIGGDVLKSFCTLERQGEGRYILEKDSPNISFLDLADVVLATAQRIEGSAKRQVLVALTKDQIQVSPGPTASLLGMRGIINRPYSLKAEFPDEAIFEQEYPVIARVTMTPLVHVFWAALWSGLAARVLTTARTVVKNEGRVGADTASAKATHLSRLVNKHYVMNALIRDATVALTGIPAASFDLLATTRVKRLKVVCSELADEICQGALGLIGLPGYAERGALSVAEPLRDALSAQILISNHRLVLANTEVERFVEEQI